MTLGYVFIYIIYTSLSYFWLIEKQISFSIWCIHINDIIYYAVSVFFFCLHPVPSTPSFFAFESGHSLFWYTFCALLFIYNILSTLKKKVMATHHCLCMILHSYANCNFCYCSDRIMVKMMMTCWEQPLRHHSITLESLSLVFTADVTAEFCVLGICHHSVISMFKMSRGTFNKQANVV